MVLTIFGTTKAQSILRSKRLIAERGKVLRWRTLALNRSALPYKVSFKGYSAVSERNQGDQRGENYSLLVSFPSGNREQ